MPEISTRTEKLLALILLETMRDATQGEKATRLKSAAFSNVEIAELLQTTPQVVGQLLYMSRAERGRFVPGGHRRRRIKPKKASRT